MSEVGERVGLGVGLDLPWHGPYGVIDGRVADRTLRFLTRHADQFAQFFISWQPRDKGVPSLDDVREVFDALFDAVPIPRRVLHQTALNLAGASYERGPILALSNALIERYGFRWVNEDLGSWSVRGRPLPYPQPPPLTPEGVAFCARTCAEVDRALDAPLVVEFPGFEMPAPMLHGALDAYDAFCQVVEQAGVYCTLDTGHLLTWRWLRGHRGEALFEGLERLPLEHCIELHCAGTEESEGMLIDAHHGILLEAQLELAARLMARCPNLQVVTYEDPRFDEDGVLPPAGQTSLTALAERVETWMHTPRSPNPGLPLSDTRERLPEIVGPMPWEDELEQAFDEDRGEFGQRCRAQLLTRSARGVGRLVDLYPEALRRWQLEAGTPAQDQPDFDACLRAFLRSSEGREWSEFAWSVPGRCIEDAFGRFLAPRSAEHLRACARVLTVHADPPFVIPEPFVRVPRGWCVVARGESQPMLYAALDGKQVEGPVTELVAKILAGARPPGAEAAVAKLASMGLL